MLGARGQEGEPPSVQKLSTKRRLCLRPDLDLDVVRGKQTAPLKRNKKAPHYACLSVVVAAHDVGDDGRRSSDLQVASLERRTRWPTPSRPPWTAPAGASSRDVGVDAAVGRRREGPGGFEKGAPAHHARRGRRLYHHPARPARRRPRRTGRWRPTLELQVDADAHVAGTFSSETRLLPPPSNVTVATSSKSSSWPTLTVTCRTDGPTSSERDERRVGDGSERGLGEEARRRPEFLPIKHGRGRVAPVGHDAPMSRTATRRAEARARRRAATAAASAASGLAGGGSARRRPRVASPRQPPPGHGRALRRPAPWTWLGSPAAARIVAIGARSAAPKARAPRAAGALMGFGRRCSAGGDADRFRALP